MRVAGVAVLCVVIAGCGPDPYREAIRRQASTYEELADFLAQVKDDKSMSEVEAKIADRMDDFQRAAARVNELPHLEPERAKSYEEEFGPKMKSALNRFTVERRRIRALPGGPAFLDRIAKLGGGESP